MLYIQNNITQTYSLEGVWFLNCISKKKGAMKSQGGNQGEIYDVTSLAGQAVLDTASNASPESYNALKLYISGQQSKCAKGMLSLLKIWNRKS